MTDVAGRWARVSGDSQSEEDQIPDINVYCGDRAYALGRIYEVHGKSAYKGAQDPDWLEVVSDVQNGAINVVVCWMVDRLDRQNILHAIPMVLAVLDAGGRVEFSEQPECNLDASSPKIDEQVKAFSDRIHAANQESKIKAKRILKKQKALRLAGSAVGRAPWGYGIVCAVCDRPPVRPDCKTHQKLFVPTAAGRKYVPVIFAMVINGSSLREIAEYLTAEGVPTTTGLPVWNEGYIGNRMIKNPMYYGHRRNAGALETEALVSYSVWQRANACLASRVKTGRTSVKLAKALLAPRCGNPACDATGKHPSPMYRVFAGKDPNRTPYYRCTGSGPQRKGCGFMVPLAELDSIVIEAMTNDHANKRIERTFIAGDDRSAVAQLRTQAMEAYQRGDKKAFRELDAQADELDTPAIPPHWETRETGQTQGEYFAGLEEQARREEIVSHWIVSASRLDDGTVSAAILPREADWLNEVA